MKEEALNYRQRETDCRGWLAYDDSREGLRPGVVIAPAWYGLDEFARHKARELAGLGFVALAADVYGDGRIATHDEEASRLMQPLFVDRSLLRARIMAAVEAIQTVEVCDTTKVGAIGFCFGGLTVIELVRSGAAIRGAVSFHGVLGSQMGDQRATLAPLASPIPAALLVLHGHDDPLVTPADIAALQNEMTQAQVDWQMHVYGHTAHAFTNPQAHHHQRGLIYQPCSAQRAWRSMQNFFEEIFQ